ncbi:MAG: acetylxylan esterase [Gemmatimonadetes bacterium]|nr:acetylxylan esterase [Gemmatimonadota bacterium]
MIRDRALCGIRRLRRAVCGLGLLGFFLAPSHSRAQEDLRVFHGPGGNRLMRYTDAPNGTYRLLAREAQLQLEQRARTVGALATEEDWRERQRWVRRTLAEAMGSFPQRTPLKARVLGTVRRDGFRVEKLVYESRPGQLVTGALFLPDGPAGRRPAIVYLSGHTLLSFRSNAYQQLILNLVHKGFVVLAIDPVGQGERLHYLDPKTGEPVVGSNTLEHSYAGAQLFLTGGSLAREMTWDAMRAVDYLATRPEVDSTRIGATGRSGGGTQTAYLAAFDPRVRAAAIENYITSFGRLWETLGPQDAEQNFFHGLARGLDHGDLLIARAPQPTLMVTTTRDIFSIQGARETYRESLRGFAALGGPTGLRMVEDDAGHESTRANREAVYAFFQEALSLPGDPRDEALAPITAAELRVMPATASSVSVGGESPFDLARATATTLSEERARTRKGGADHLSRVITAARRLSGFRDPATPTEPVFIGRFRRAGYVVEKYVLDGEGGHPMPYLLMLPDGGARKPAMVYLHPSGKAAEAGPGGEMERLVRQGYVVAAPDLPGIGEVGPGDFRGDSYGFRTGPAPFGLWFGAMLVGRSLAGVQAGDLVRLVRVLGGRPDVAAGGIDAVAKGEMASVLLHGAAFEPAFSRVALVDPLVSYTALATSRYYRTSQIPAAVAGMLTAYDLPDLAAAVAPRPLLLLDVVDAAGVPLPEARVVGEMRVARDAFQRTGALERLWIRRSVEGESQHDVLDRWLRLPRRSPLRGGQP